MEEEVKMMIWRVATVAFITLVLGTEAVPKGVSKYTRHTVQAPAGQGDAALTMMVPVTTGDRSIQSPTALFNHVQHVWDVVVANNQAGLSDANQKSLAAPELSPREAWHHFNAVRPLLFVSLEVILFSAQTGAAWSY
jgi:hypothetical protein